MMSNALPWSMGDGHFLSPVDVWDDVTDIGQSSRVLGLFLSWGRSNTSKKECEGR